MMQSMKRFVQAGFIAGLLVAGARARRRCAPRPTPTAVDTSGPSQLIESSANILLTGIDARRAEFRKDPTGLYELVGNTLLPHFDTPYAAQLVLGQHWRNATPEQRKRFVDAFYQSLLYTYGDAMVDFTGDRLKVLPTKVAPDGRTRHGAHRDQALERHQGRRELQPAQGRTARGRPGTWSSTASAT